MPIRRAGPNVIINRVRLALLIAGSLAANANVRNGWKADAWKARCSNEGFLMLAAAVAVQVSRCALLSLCPTNQDIRAALHDMAWKAASSSWEAASRVKHPDDIVHVHIKKIGRVDDVHCGDKSAGEAMSVTCSFKVTVSDQVTYQIAEMARREGRWTVVGSMSVIRKVEHRSRP